MTDPMDQVSADEAKGFFAALFDFSFSSYVTKRFIKLIYVIATVLIGLGVLMFAIAAIASGDAGTILAGLIFAPLFGLFYLIFTRIGLEIIVVIFGIADDTSAMRKSAESK